MSKSEFNGTDKFYINTIRGLCIDMIGKANSGHPGAPLGLAPLLYTMYTRILKHNPKNPNWMNRDRFILSGGHVSSLLYVMLHLTGYDISLDDLKNFRQLGSKCSGHPEYMTPPGIETTTGPLGQGFTNAIGIAIAEKLLASILNKRGFDIVNHYTYVQCGDGDLMEGISYEASSLAGHLGLGKLIVIYDSNNITIEGNTSITFTENVEQRFLSQNWQVLRIKDGNSLDLIYSTILEAKKETKKPTLIIMKTKIGYGSTKEDTPDAHGSPLNPEGIIKTKKFLNLDETKSFYIPPSVESHINDLIGKKEKIEKEWAKLNNKYKRTYPEMIEDLNKSEKFWEKNMPVFDKPIATREASGKILNAICNKHKFFIGGSADLAPSTKTYIDSSLDFQFNLAVGRNIRFGVREHAMAAIASGIALYGNLRPFVGTFLVFSDYMKTSIRMAAMMNLPVTYIFTHDSIAVGEDGPTHQPIEQLMSLRLIPNLTVIRPADGLETIEAWKYIVKNNKPIALILSRQNLPILDRSKCKDCDISKGAYILHGSDEDIDIVLISTGSEVHLAIEVAKELEKNGKSVRVVNMPSWELFEKQSKEYKNKVLPPNIKRVSIEAGASLGWERYVQNGLIVGIDEFGKSAPYKDIFDHCGFTVEKIVKVLS